jgi:rhodanese-related sulfurtransferase
MITQIRPAQLAQWLVAAQEHGEPVVLDVREPHELQMASITAHGFTLRTVPMGSVPTRLAELDPAQPIACLCHHGMRSLQVANFLQSQGFAHVVNIAGGIHAWSAEVDPSVACY